METDFNEFNERMFEQWINEFTVKTKSNYITLAAAVGLSVMVISVICTMLSSKALLMKSYFSSYCLILLVIFLSLSSSLCFSLSCIFHCISSN